MGKIIRLTERDLTRLIRRVISEQYLNSSVIEKLDIMNNNNQFIKKGKPYFEGKLFVLNFLSKNPISDKNVAIMYDLGSDKIEIRDGKSYKKIIPANEIDNLPKIVNPLLKIQ